MLIDRLGPPWHREALADALKLEWGLAEYPECETDAEVLDKVNAHKVEFPRVRKALIDWGATRREQDLEWWLKQLPLKPGAIVTDCRYENERAFLKERGFLMVRIEVRPDVLRARGYNCPVNHPSECELDNRGDWDVVVCNNRGIEVLETAVDEIVKMVTIPHQL
jgi:phosphomevalonate kinase